MKSRSLEKLQLYSLIVTGVASAITLARAIVVVRILTPEEFGFIGLVLAVGAIIGIVQHLGIDSASVREISVAKDEREASKVFVVALLFRLLISLPLALVLFLGAEPVSRYYNNPLMFKGLRIFSTILILQGVQGVFEATLGGLQRFNTVFALRLVQASVSFVLFTLLTYYFRAYGYFYAMLCSVFIVLLSYMLVLATIFRGSFILPTTKEFKQIFKNIFNLGMVVYSIKILNTIWARAGILILGKYVAPAEVGYFNFALTFGEKSAIANKAINSINLPVLTKLYATNIDRFRELFEENFQKLFVIGYSVLVSAILFSRELIVILGGAKYSPASRIFPLILLAFFVYFLFNLIGAGVLFPTKSLKGVLKVQFLSRVGSILLTWILIWRGVGIKGAAVGLLMGTIPVLIYYTKIAFSRVDVKTFDIRCAWLVLILLPAMAFSFREGIIGRVLMLSISLVVYFTAADKLGILRLGSYTEKVFAKGTALISNQKGIENSHRRR